jgi:MFS transporter, FSR family, fosmidomycin resistance protein
MTTITALSGMDGSPTNRRMRVLWGACGAHALHDGFTDTLYLLLPLLQTEFALGYAAVGLLRALYAGAMAGLQVPAAGIAQRIGGVKLLAIGTAIAAAAYLCLGQTASLPALALALILGGIGSSTQHPIASGFVAAAYEGPGSRSALGTYNFAGDLGKMALPALTAGLIAIMTWHRAATLVGMLGLFGAVAVAAMLRGVTVARSGHAAAASPSEAAKAGRSDAPPRGGFPVLLVIGILDSATRMGFLTFLPFLLRAKGAGVPEIGVALTLVFAGGAAGKLVCGFLGARLGVLATVLITEGATAAGIAALLPLPIGTALALLPIIGVALNGTSSVLYGTVPELVAAQRREHAFGVFYTGTIGAGAVSPALYGLLSDGLGLRPALVVVAAAVLLTLPLAWRLQSILGAASGDAGAPAPPS